MILLRVDGTSPDPLVVERALAVILAGGLLIYPTDTLYALGGRGLDGRAADAVRRAKGRPDGRPLPLVAAGLAQVAGLCSALPEAVERLAARFWPGPLTLILPAALHVPSGVTAGTGTVAVRVPALELPRRLCAAGPLVSTSANLTGVPAPATCEDAVAGVGTAAALALDAGAGRGIPSTVVDLVGVPRLVRAGAVPWPEVVGVLRTGHT